MVENETIRGQNKYAVALNISDYSVEHMFSFASADRLNWLQLTQLTHLEHRNFD